MEPRSVRVEASGYQPLVVLLAAVAGGISLDAALDPGFTPWLLISIASLLASWRLRNRGWTRVATALLLASVLGLGGTWHHVAWRRFPANDLGRQLDATPRPVCLEVDVESEPRRIPAPTRHPLANYPPRDETECLVRIRALRHGTQWRMCGGLARLTVPGVALDAHCGDRLRVLAVASRPAPPGNPGEYDVAAAERGQRRLVRLNSRSDAAVQVVHACRSWTWRRWLSDVRDAGQQCLRRHVSAKQAALASALLLGTREQLDPQLNQTFFVTGLAHLLAISGLNVAIFAYGFWAIVRLGWLPRRLALVLVALLAVFYALLTGAEPPVVRAAILVVCICGARLLARQGLAYNTLAAAGLLVLAANPTSLFQTGTQLSFLAVAVLCRDAAARPQRAADDPLDALIDRSRPWWERFLRRGAAWTWQAFATSGRVWLMSLPLVAWRFHLVSPVALVLNPLVLLPAAVSLYAGFLTLVLGSTLPAAASWTGNLCGRSLEFIDALLVWGRSVPGNHYWTPGPTLSWVLVFYGAAALTPLSKLPRRWSWSLAVVAVAVMLSPLPRMGWPWRGAEAATAPNSDSTLNCTFVSVGHGTSVLVEWSDGRTLLYDCGRLGWPSQGSRAIASVLWSRGVSRLDAIVISHADTDHFNALPDLLDRFSVGAIYVSPRMFARPDSAVAALREAIRARGVACRTLSAGDRLWPDRPGRLEVLHPPVDRVNGNDNAASIVLSIEVDGRRVLLPGDLEGEGMERFLKQDPRHYDVVMAPHHGSAHGNSPTLLAWARPDWIVVSGSVARANTAAQRFDPGLARLLHTARDGAIRLELSRDSVRAWTWKGKWIPYTSRLRVRNEAVTRRDRENALERTGDVMTVDTRQVEGRRALRFETMRQLGLRLARYVVISWMWAAVGSTATAQLSTPDNVAEEEQPVSDDHPLPLNMNLIMPTMGGTQIWTDEMVHGEYRIQRNVLTGHYRLLDDQDKRLAWGTIGQCQTRFDQMVADRHLRPVTGKIVILLHGLGRSKAVMQPMGEYLQEKGGYTAIRMNYASMREGVEQHAQALERVVDHLTGAREINFVCHSLGNIVVRHYLADEARRPPAAKRPPLKRIVMLGPPNNGALIARRLQTTGLFGLIAGRSGESLGRDWDQLVGNLATPACEFGIIAGGKGNEKGNNPLLPGDDDLVVTVEETRLAGAADFLLVPKRHSSLLKDEGVREATLRFLRQGCFREDGKREPIDE